MQLPEQIPECYIIRHGVGPYTGPIRIGQVFAWSPDIPEARLLIIVTHIGTDSADRLFLHSSGVAELSSHQSKSSSDGIIWSRPLHKPENGMRDDEYWNEEDHFRHSVFDTRFRSMKLAPERLLAKPTKNYWVPTRLYKVGW